MANFVLVSPGELPAPPLPLWESMSHSWTGFDGTTFDLDVFSAGVCLLLDGVTGLHMPEFDQFVDEAASVPGGRYRGSRAKVRNPEWTLGVFGDSSAQWLERDRAFWGTMRPDLPGMWTVGLPDGSSRSLMCRFRSSSEFSYGRDPLQAGWAVYQVALLAEQPFWEGAPVLSPIWGNAVDPEDFTGPDDEAPSYFVEGATTLGSAALTNAGDVDSPLTWVVEGRGAGVTSVSIDGDAGSLGFGAVPAGSRLVVRTDPTRPTALLDGVDVTGLVNPWNPLPISPGGTVGLGITLVGEGTVQASFSPRFLRAF